MAYPAYRGRAVRTLLAFSIMSGVATAAFAADIDIVLDQAKLQKLPDRVTTIVVGNPLIADAAVQTGGLMVVTGKGYGATNVLALDRAGNVLMEKTIEVRGPDVVVVFRGVERESYSCAPTCERRITLGDSQPYFEATIGQTGTRNGQAQTSK
jgi:Flp pilus assembly secretin CpaC